MIQLDKKNGRSQASINRMKKSPNRRRSERRRSSINRSTEKVSKKLQDEEEAHHIFSLNLTII